MTKKELFAGWNERMFLDDPAAVAAYCRKYWPEECSHIIRVADEVCRGYFLFDLKWDMERTWEPVVFPEGKGDWEYKPWAVSYTQLDVYKRQAWRTRRNRTSR